MTALARRNLRAKPNQDGTGDTDFPLGDKDPNVIALSWNNAALQAGFGALIGQLLVGGGAFSSNVRQYLAGTHASIATFIFQTVSGSDAVANGWSSSGNNATNPRTNAGAGAFRIGAVDTSGPAYTDPIPWSCIVPITDTLAPCIPTGGTVVAGQGQLIFTCDIPGDAHDGTNPGAMASVTLTVDGIDHAKTVGAGLSPTWTTLNFGASTPSPGFVQTGNSWALTGGGAGFQGTLEQFPFKYTALSGDFMLTCKVTAVTSSQVFGSVGLMVRENITGLDRFVSVCVQETDGSVQIKSRSVQGASASNQSTSASGLALPIWLQIQRVGNVLQSRYSQNGGVWVQLPDQPFAYPATVYAGFLISSLLNGTSITATMDQIWVNNLGRQTFDPIVTNLAKTGTFKATDAAGNVSAASVGCAGTPIVTAYKKWHVGHGIRTNLATVSASSLNALAADSEFLYCDMECRWVQVAPTLNARDYTLLDNHRAACVARGKKAILQVSYKIFNTSNPALLMPSDFQHYSTASNGFIANVWDTALDVMGEYIKLMQDVAARYDGDSAVELVLTPESSSGLPSPLPAGFTRAGYANQLKRMYAALGPLSTTGLPCFQHTPLIGQVNYTTGEIAGLIQSLYQNGCGMGDPDAIPTTANTIFNGGATDNANIAPFDYRGKMPRLSMASTATLGGAYDNGPPSNVIDYMQTGGTTHGLWVLGRPAPNATSSILAAIDADPTLASACPLSYNNTCLTS